MKSWFLRIIGFVFILFGAVGFAVAVEEFGSDEPQNLILGPVASAMFITIGLLIFRAVKVKYQFTLSIVMGTGLVFFGFAVVAIELENLITGKPGELIVGLIVAAVFLISGVLLIRAGHRRHLEAISTPPPC